MVEASILYTQVYNLFIALNQTVECMMEDLSIDLSFGQYPLMKFISTKQEHRISQKQLDSYSSLRKPSISQLLKTLRNKGYILHQTMDENNRCKEIILTEKALHCIQLIDQSMTATLLNTMREEDVVFYIQSLSILKQLMERKE